MKNFFSPTDVETLNAIPLTAVMEINDCTIIYSDSKSAWFSCPFHNGDNTPSFSVSLLPPENRKYNCFQCFACHAKGEGAVALQRLFEERNGTPREESFLAACNSLALNFSLTNNDNQSFANDVFHRSEKIEDVEEFSFQPVERLFTIQELRALGCQCFPSYQRSTDDDGQLKQHSILTPDNKQIYSFSWQRFNINQICDRLNNQFNLFAVESCKFPTSRNYSVLERATKHFPIFVFKYSSGDNWWCRKYEPLYKTTVNKDGSKNKSYKFTWWRNRGNNASLADNFYADNELQNVIDFYKDVPEYEVSLTLPKIENKEGFHPVVETDRILVDENGEIKKNHKAKVFNKIVICSGPRDAINVYMHSEAHVLFPHSEHAQIPDKLIRILLQISKSVYVLYDNDAVGKLAQKELCLRHLELIPLYLPDKLSEIYNPRSQKFCKDITEFFNLYKEKGFSNDFLFNQMLMKSKPLKFWKTSITRHRTEIKSEYSFEEKYEIDPASLALFLQAMGFHAVVTVDTSKKIDRVSGYCIIGPYKDELVSLKENQVEVIPIEQGMHRVWDIVYSFLKNYPLSENEALELPNAIATQRKFTAESLRQKAKRIRLNTTYWPTEYNRISPHDKDTEFVFYRNTAVKITPDSIEEIPYSKLNFHVNRATVINEDFHSLSPQEELANIPRVSLNNDLDKMLANIDIAISQAYNNEQKSILSQQRRQIERLWKFKLLMPNTPFAQLSPLVQWIVDIGKLYWQKQEEGLVLSHDEMQRQNMITIIAMHAIGFCLCRYRTKAMIQYVLFTDYNTVDEEKEAGGTGKSTVIELLKLVSPVCHIIGQTFKRKENFSKNFDKFVESVDRVICIDDIRADVDGSEFNGVTEGLDVKNLYHDETRIPFDLCPKFVISTNKLKFDASKPSTYRRMILVPISDFFHPADIAAARQERNYITEFGHDPIKETDDHERQTARHLLHKCIQLYLRFPEVIEVPFDDTILNRIQHSSIGDKDFVEWAQVFFSDPNHFQRPISIREMQLSFARKKGVQPLSVDVVHRGEKAFVNMVDSYIKNCGIRRIDDERVWRKSLASKLNFNGPRWKSWNTQTNNGFFLIDQPRIIEQAPCLFFYRQSDPLPKTSADILTCGDTDPEADNLV